MLPGERERVDEIVRDQNMIFSHPSKKLNSIFVLIFIAFKISLSTITSVSLDPDRFDSSVNALTFKCKHFKYMKSIYAYTCENANWLKRNKMPLS